MCKIEKIIDCCVRLHTERRHKRQEMNQKPQKLQLLLVYRHLIELI